MHLWILLLVSGVQWRHDRYSHRCLPPNFRGRCSPVSFTLKNLSRWFIIHFGEISQTFCQWISKIHWLAFHEIFESSSSKCHAWIRNNFCYWQVWRPNPRTGFFLRLEHAGEPSACFYVCLPAYLPISLTVCLSTHFLPESLSADMSACFLFACLWVCIGINIL